MENKKSKKKVLLYYLVLAVCLLIIAAVTVAVVLTVGRKPSNLADGTQITTPDDDGKKPDNTDPDDSKKPDDGDNQPTGSDNTWGLPLEKASVSCGYELAYDKTLTRYAVHQGMDFEAKAGDKVLAVKGGTVTKIVQNHLLNENFITISHGNGVTSTYMYINAKDGIKVGDTVKKGDVIGTVTAAGGFEANEGEHLHFEINVNGRTADPDIYLDLVEK